MQAGILNSRITVQRKIENRSEYGDVVVQWQDFGEFWANVRNISGKEFGLRGLDLAQLTTSIRIRLNREITAQMRVLFRGQIYEIVAVIHDEQWREFTDLACRSGLNEAGI